MKKIKIVYVISQLAYGGAETSLYDICRFIDKSKFEIIIISILTGDSLENLFMQIKGVRVISLNFNSRINPLIPLKICFNIFMLKPDIIHTHLPVANIYTRISAFFFKTVFVCTRHTVVCKNNLFYKIDLYTSKINKYMIANSLFTKEFLIRYKYIDERKIEILKLGLDFSKFQKSAMSKNDFLKKYSLNEKAKIIVNVGSFKQEKGHIYLLQAMQYLIKKHPEYYLFLAGKGFLLGEIKDKAIEYGIEKNIIFTGNLDNISNVMDFADLFVSASISESFGVSLIEAMYFKVPVIAFNVDAVPNLIKDGETGFMVDLFDYKALAIKIIEVLNKDNQDLVETAYSFVKKEYAIQKTVKDLEEFYIIKVLK